MNNTDITNTYELGPNAGGKPKSLVILLHGLGSNGQDLISLAPMWLKKLPYTVFVSPDAPYPCDMVPPGYPNSYQWFSLQSRDPQHMEQGASNVSPTLEAFIKAQMEKYGVPADKTALVGFSQGTMMSLYTGLRMDEALGGILGYSGAMIGGAGAQKLPVHLIHGEDDDVVPVEARAHAQVALKNAGIKVTGHTSDNLTHSIDEKGIESGGTFLKEILNL
jgi:phospholipase/carboxylesterase